MYYRKWGSGGGRGRGVKGRGRGVKGRGSYEAEPVCQRVVLRRGCSLVSGPAVPVVGIPSNVVGFWDLDDALKTIDISLCGPAVGYGRGRKSGPICREHRAFKARLSF